MAEDSKKTTADSLTAATPANKKKDDVPRVRVFIPPLEEDDSGLKVDQYEHVTVDGATTLIRRGEYVDVTIPVFMQLRNKFPHI